MSLGESLSLLINIAVGIYFIRYYPAQLKKSFQGKRLPPFFALMQRWLPPLGWLLVVGSVVYGIWRITDPVGASL